jgi:hypothetical protein
MLNMSKDHPIRFTINGKVFKKRRGDFLQVPVLIPTKARKYSAQIGCRRVSPQEAIAAVIGIPAAQISSQTAMRILQRLGFRVDLVE